MKYLIVGNSAAGIGAVEGIREIDQEGQITLISDENYHTYSRPLISYYLAGNVDIEGMKYRSDDFYRKQNVKTRLGEKVVSLNSAQKCVTLETGEQTNFDKLLLATGGRPFFPLIQGINKENVYSFIKLNDVKVIADRIGNLNSDRGVVILGAGLIGLKAAEALVKLNFKVTVVELADQILSRILDQKAAALVQKHMENEGICFKLADTIEKFEGDKEANSVILKSGLEINCDLAIIAVGVRPQVSIVKDTGIDINKGILVSKKMETSIQDIYAAGDVAEGFNMLAGSAGVIPIWPNAYNQGLTAGKNMAGGKEIYQEGFARNSISFFDLPLITAGIINPEEDKGFQTIVKEDLDVDELKYRKFVLKNDILNGFIFIKEIDRAGIFTGLLKEQKDIGDIKGSLLKDDFGYLSFEQSFRKEKLLK